MPDQEDFSFGKIAIKKGYCTKAQMEDALKTLKRIRSLGLDDQLGSILIKNKYLTKDQVRKVLQIQGKKNKSKIAGYEILEKVGQGGMGAVFKARQMSLDRIVALKILSPKLASDKQFCERFIKEARAVAKLSHPNIIVGIDVGKYEKYYYFAMEFVDGETTLRELKRKGLYSEEKALKIALDMALALAHAHKNNLVHRDLKPDNIMLTKRGVGKLCDLGLAKVIEQNASMTTVGTAIGTPHYIAPEQARGESDVDIRADFYALGATLYHLVTGQTLFNAGNSTSIMAQHLTEEAPCAKEKNPKLSDAFCNLLVRLLAKDKHHRHPDPKALQEDIKRVMDGEDILSPLPPSAASSMKNMTGQTTRLAASRSNRSKNQDRKISQRFESTSTRAPLGHPDPTTSIRYPVNRSKGTALVIGTVAVAVFLVLILVLQGGGNQFSGGPTENASTGSNSADPAKADLVKGAPRKPSKNEKAGKPKASKPKTSRPKASEPKNTNPEKWKPLITARKARKESPDNLVELIRLYDLAEKGAPKNIQAIVKTERSAIKKQLDSAFKSLLNEKKAEAKRKARSGHFQEAIDMLVPENFPKNVMNEYHAVLIRTEQNAIVHLVYDQFAKDTKPDLEKQISAFLSKEKALPEDQAKIFADLGNLQKLQSRLEKAKKAYPNPRVGAFISTQIDAVNIRKDKLTQKFLFKKLDEIHGLVQSNKVADAKLKLLDSKVPDGLSEPCKTLLSSLRENLTDVENWKKEAVDAPGKLIPKKTSTSPTIEGNKKFSNKPAYIKETASNEFIKFLQSTNRPLDGMQKAQLAFWHDELHLSERILKTTLNRDPSKKPQIDLLLPWIRNKNAKDLMQQISQLHLKHGNIPTENEFHQKAREYFNLFRNNNYSDTPAWKKRNK